MLRWALAGSALGALVALVAWAPAAWLCSAVYDATAQRLLMADARGTVWRGSAVMVLTGGAGSRTSSALPGRLHWDFGLDGAALAVRARQDCCINGELQVRVVPGLGRLRIELPGATAAAAAPAAAPGSAGRVLGQWPASWLVGLGTPWNTLQPTGTLQLSSPGVTVEQVQGRWLFNGRAEIELASMASRLSSLDTLGSYRLVVNGNTSGNPNGDTSGNPVGGQPTQLQLSTTSGALQLTGDGQWGGAGTAAKLRFNGAASAAPGFEAALGGLLNIIGRRQGAISVITIG